MELSGKRVVVMGLGRFGGGLGVTQYLVKQGADVLVTDLLPAEQLQNSLNQLNDLPLQYRLGQHLTQDFVTADLIVVNPAVDQRGNPFLESARSAGVPLTSEIRLLVNALPNPKHVIGVTGTAGKSTVTAMIGHLLAKLHSPRNVHVGGNLGGSLLGRVDQIKATDWVVLELSSFMLQELDDNHWSPHTAVVTNLMPNHLDRHDGMKDYTLAKQTILRHQRPEGKAILGSSVADWPTNPGVKRYLVSDTHSDIELLLPGAHNRLNAACAALTVAALEDSEIDPSQHLADFTGLPHRLQLVCENAGVRFYNDSKATTPEAAQLAIQSLEAKPIHAILGGYDKGVDLTTLGQFAGKHCRRIYTIGATAHSITNAANQAGGCASHCDTIDQAVKQASQHAQAGDVVLLSPGCASWDQFKNYEYRGQAFVKAIFKYNTEASLNTNSD